MNLRFVERQINVSEYNYKIIKVLQYYTDQYGWVDVPLVTLKELEQ